MGSGGRVERAARYGRASMSRVAAIDPALFSKRLRRLFDRRLIYQIGIPDDDASRRVASDGVAHRDFRVPAVVQTLFMAPDPIDECEEIFYDSSSDLTPDNPALPNFRPSLRICVQALHQGCFASEALTDIDDNGGLQRPQRQPHVIGIGRVAYSHRAFSLAFEFERFRKIYRSITAQRCLDV